MHDSEILLRRLEQEKAARKEAEALLEQKSLEVYEANQKLVQLADQTKAIVDTAAEGIISYDESGKIHLFNRSANRIFRCEKAVGRNIRDFFELGDQDESVLFPLCDLNAPESPNQAPDACSLDPIELIGTRMGQSFCAEVATSRNTREDGTLYTMLVRDLTRRKRLEAQLGQAKKMESIGQLAAGIAHEINTPIQFVGDNILFLQGAFEDLNGLLDLYAELEEGIKTGKSAAAILSRIEAQSELADLGFLRREFPGAIQQSLDGIERVAKIVRAMKEFSQAPSDCKTSADLNNAIENAVAVVANQFGNSMVTETCLDPDLGPVPCFAGQMNQCILNLLANAYEVIQEHCEAGTGRVWITTKRNDDLAEICIEDNGPGIPASIQERIFEPFFTTKEVGKGMGQGLAYVYDVIVDKHGGEIQALAAPSGGALFRITIPIHAVSAKVAASH